MKRFFLVLAVLSTGRSAVQAQITRHYASAMSPAPPLTPVSQLNDKQLYLDLTGGAAFPMREYAARNHNTGTADNGDYLALSGVYLFTPQLGFCAVLSGSRSSSDPAAGARQFALAAGSRNARYDAGNWSVASALIGCQFTAPITPHLALDFRPLAAGLAYTVAPRYGVTYQTAAGAPQSRTIASTGSVALGWQTGADIRVRILPCISLRAGASYFAARPRFQSGEGNSPEYLQQVSILNVGGGVSYEWGLK